MDKKNHSLSIIHRESTFVIVDKPGGLLAVPGRGPHKQDCVVNRAKQMIPEMISQPAVHRLDLPTSGLMLLAIDQATHTALSRQFEQRLVKKRYVALLDGIIKKDQGIIELPFRLDPDHRPLQIHDPIRGKIGISHWKRLAVEKERTRVEFRPVTGRTHQLRIHAAHPLGLGTPIVGDFLYGTGKDGDPMYLHACFLEFTHPQTGQRISFSSQIPF